MTLPIWPTPDNTLSVTAGQSIRLPHRTSRGIPRAVDNLALQALIAAFADGKGMVDESAARAPVTEVTGD
jgi:type II secretory pathway predicted ATPase ExeA